MRYLLQNFSNFQHKISKGSTVFHGKDYPYFNLILGYLLTKIQNFQQLFNCLECAWKLTDEAVLPNLQFYQFLNFLYTNPNRIDQCTKFLQIVQSKNQNMDFNLIEELEQLFVSQQYRPKRKLNQQQRNNSIDTVVLGTLEMDNNPGFEIEEEALQNGKNMRQIDQSSNLSASSSQHDSIRNQIREDYQYDVDAIKNMQQDERMARLLQDQQQNVINQRKPILDQQQLCEICYVDLYDGQFSLLDKCTHIFHKNCLIQSFKAQISENNFPLKCPNQECKIEIIESNIQQILSAELYKKYQQHTLKAYADLHGDTVSWCPTANCNYMFFHQKGDDIRFQCLECKKQYCLNCRCEWHKDMTCKQYQISNTMSEQDKKFFDFARGAKFKQCPKCKFWVEKNQGCDHMTCKCKFEFCYKCGGVYMKCQCVQNMRRQQQERRRLREVNLAQKQQRKKKLAQSKRQNARVREQKRVAKQQKKRLVQEERQAYSGSRRGRSKSKRS